MWDRGLIQVVGDEIRRNELVEQSAKKVQHFQA